MKFLNLHLLIISLFLISCFGCKQNKPSGQSADVDEYDSIFQDSVVGFGVIQNVVYRFPTPGGPGTSWQNVLRSVDRFPR